MYRMDPDLVKGARGRPRERPRGRGLCERCEDGAYVKVTRIWDLSEGRNSLQNRTRPRSLIKIGNLSKVEQKYIFILLLRRTGRIQHVLKRKACGTPALRH